MRRSSCFISFAVSVAVAAHAGQPVLHGNPAAAHAIVDADLAFNALAREQGTAKAFRDAMDATDGVIYGGGGKAAKGRDAIYSAMGGEADSRVLLQWQPEEVFAAQAGDMGVSRGRWTLSPKTADAKPVATGSYVTVWRRNADGKWKGLVDIGNEDKPLH